VTAIRRIKSKDLTDVLINDPGISEFRVKHTFTKGKQPRGPWVFDI
jgi:hypothetical protein